MSLSKQYTKEIFNNLGYHASWLPNTILRLGDIGYIKDHKFESVYSLDDLGISYEVNKDKAPADYEYTSRSGISITTKLAGKMPAIGSYLTKAEAGICLNFNSANAVVFQAGDCEIFTIKNKNKLAEDILALKEKGEWSADYVVITTIVKSKSATILISNESGGKVELAADSGIQAGTSVVATLKTSNKLKYSSKVGIQIIASENLTPLFKVSGIKRGFFFMKDSFITRGEANPHTNLTAINHSDAFSELNLDELQELEE